MAQAPRRIRPASTIARLVCCASLLATAMVAGGCGGPPRPTSGDRLEWADYNVALYQSQNWYLNRAKIRLERGMLDGALEDCNAAVNYRGKKKNLQQSEMPELYELRGNVLELKKEYAPALADIEKAFAMAIEQRGPTDPMWHLNTKRQAKGRLLCRLGRLAEAEAVAAEMLSSGSRSLEFHPGLELIAMVYQAR